MRAIEFITETSHIDEDWKSAVATGAAALGLSGLAGALKPNVPANPQQTQQVKQQEFKPISSNPQLETFLQKTAAAAGMKGVELAQFLAQVKHESWDFTKLAEKGGALDFRKYDPKYNPRVAKILGNTHVGDGQRYHGRGFIQLTGRENYRKAGQALNLPLEENPDLAAKPDVAAKVAVWFWNNRVKPYVQNFTNTTEVTKRINAGLRGLQDRQENFQEYLPYV